MAYRAFLNPNKPCFLIVFYLVFYLFHFRYLQKDGSLFDVDIDIGLRVEVANILGLYIKYNFHFISSYYPLNTKIYQQNP